jgi:hypothetical protein
MASLSSWRYKGDRLGFRLLVSVFISLSSCFTFRFRWLVEPCPAHVPAYVQERLFWKGVFSIGFFIRNESPSSHIMCAQLSSVYV